MGRVAFSTLQFQAKTNTMNTTLEHILLIDDSNADNMFHTITINQVQQGFKIKAINNSIHALEYLSSGLSSHADEFQKPLLVFVDINMPALNGFELLEKYRNIPDPNGVKKNLTIYMLTGSLNPDDKALALDKFSDIIAGFCIKPLSESVFREIVDKHF